MFYKPTNIIISELLSKEDLPKIRLGLYKLIKKHTSHKFIIHNLLERDIDNLIFSLDERITSGRAFYKAGIYDFACIKKLDKYIDYFEIIFRNFSSSYVVIEMHISLSQDLQHEMEKRIRNNYQKPYKQVTKTWINSRKKCGSKIGYSVSSGPGNETVKSRLVYEQIQNIKIDFLNYMNNYFPFVFFRNNYAVLGINVFETNIDFRKKQPYNFLTSVGIDLTAGFLISEYQKLFNFTSTLLNDERDSSDMIMVYNPIKVKDYSGYGNAHNYILDNFKYILNDIYRILILKNTALYYINCCVKYRNIINRMKIHQNRYSQLLKLKYKFETDFYLYKKFQQEISVAREIEYVTKILDNNTFSKHSCYYGYYPYKSFTSFPQNLLKQIDCNKQQLEKDLDDKINISYNLKNYVNEKRTHFITYLQTVFIVATFILLIFPDKIPVVATCFRTIWAYLMGLFI